MRERRLPTAVRLVGLAVAGALVAVSSAGATFATDTARSSSGCDLNSQGNRIQHVVNIVFDNTHFTRDDPNVPSDLEQMPNLLNFITGSGTLISHEHTPLISHTGTDILTSLTGQYGDQMGVPVSNAFSFYDTGANGTPPPGRAQFRSMFQYWTDRLGGRFDNSFNMITPAGKNAPAPWVPFTRAGCSVGAVASANTVLENTFPNVRTVFGQGSPEDQEEVNAFNIPCGFDGHPPCTPEQQKAKNQPAADFVGIAVHCGNNTTGCAGTKQARPDLLPDEPGGYTGFKALFGAKHTNPVISAGGTVTDLNGGVIADSTGNPGFPGFDAMSAGVSLGYVAAMQEHGVPVTYSYISDAHDNHSGRGTFGPGEAGFVTQLKAYDDAFGKFFARLQRDGLTRANTLFTFTSDEGDHFVGGQGSPAGCDGVHVPCTYSKIGELNASLDRLWARVPPFSNTGGPAVPSVQVHSDSAPTVYVDANPAQTDPGVRALEQASKHIEGLSPITNETDRITSFLAGTAEMRALHMLTGDPRRNPTFTLFANPDYFLCVTNFPCQSSDPTTPLVTENPAFAWNHGDVSPDINTTWLGMVGPGVRHLGVDGAVWSDHANDRPTVLALLGLEDDYRHEGRVLAEVIDRRALPAGFGDADAYVKLSQVFEQINAPVGQFGLATLKLSTATLESTSTGDAVFAAGTKRLADLGTARDQVATEISERLDRTVTSVRGDHDHDSAETLEHRSLDLLQQAWLAAGE
jgi:hypothetical protein